MQMEADASVVLTAVSYTGSVRNYAGIIIVSIGKRTILVSSQAEKHDGFTRNLEKKVLAA